MITKETFCKVLALIKEQSAIDEQFNNALDLVGNGHFVYGAENKYLEGLLLLLKEAMGKLGVIELQTPVRPVTSGSSAELPLLQFGQNERC